MTVEDAGESTNKRLANVLLNSCQERKGAWPAAGKNGEQNLGSRLKGKLLLRLECVLEREGNTL